MSSTDFGSLSFGVCLTLLAAFGEGCHALLLRLADAIGSVQPRCRVEGALAHHHEGGKDMPDRGGFPSRNVAAISANRSVRRVNGRR
ncbi:MAG: hypothetical protein MUE48_10035 [Desulfobacterales bacterium]|jgi:hypothetical protein|nr:hypothetical protein [Desulfobacterales bacterium]